MDVGSSVTPDFARLEPQGADYASRPIDAAFDWGSCAQPGASGEWYLVVFRSIRRETADQLVLDQHDTRAHHEAELSPGFVHYFRGPLTANRECLSFCLWTDRAAARDAAGKPAHREAITLIAEMYERYTLEFYRVSKQAGAATFDITPYDPPAVAA